MIEFLVYLIVVCIILGLVYYLLTLLPLPAPFKNIILVAAILIFILILLGMLWGGVPMPRFPR